MKLLPLIIIFPLAAFTYYSQDPAQRAAQPPKESARTEVQLELDQTASSFKAGDFAVAQQHAERAVLLDPTNKTAAIFLARVTHQRYKPGDNSPENLNYAQGAIAAYQRVLTLDPLNEEPYKAVAVLYASTHQDELLKEWLAQRALDPRFSNAQRAEAYATLAGKDWDCSFKFTERPEQKIRTVEKGKAVVTYKMPQDQTAFARTKECVNHGFEMVDLALSLNRESEAAWSYNANLLLEAAKLAEMEGRAAAKANFRTKANEASREAVRLSDKRRRAEESGELEPKPSPTPSPALPY
jgi:hypothetical protein